LGLFETPTYTGVAGEKFEYVPNGSYIGELVGYEEGPTFKDQETGEDQPKVRWQWKLYMPDGTTPFINDGEQVIISELTSTKTGRGSTAGKWFEHHLKRSFDNRKDDVEATMRECIGTRAMLIVTEKASGYKKIDVFRAGA
jgi:hypothetical protein